MALTKEVVVNNDNYRVILHTDDNGGFFVDVPRLPGCASQGEDEKEALRMIKDAIKGHLEVEATL